MSIRKVNFVEGEFYHIYNRGNSKQRIFLDKKDFEHFIDLMFLLNRKENLNIFHLQRNKNFYVYEIEPSKEKLVYIGAYCLMPNHFHILLTPSKDGDVSKFMQKLSTAYVMYFNKKYSRSGSLFEGKFRSEHANNDKYLKYLFSYIHLNPVKLIQKDWKSTGIKDKKKVLKYLNSYQYSSYLDYIYEKREKGIVLNKEFFPKYFDSKRVFSSEIFDWLTLNENALGKT